MPGKPGLNISVISVLIFFTVFGYRVSLADQLVGLLDVPLAARATVLALVSLNTHSPMKWHVRLQITLDLVTVENVNGKLLTCFDLL